MSIQCAQTLRSDTFLILNQTLNIIHIDYMIDQSNGCGKYFTHTN